MGELYLRKVVLDLVSALGGTKRIDGLRIRFKCEKTNESNPNTAEIEIFNLSDKTRSLLEAKKTKIRLSIGYLGLGGTTIPFLSGGGSSKSNVETVFVGNITKVLHKIESPDIITSLEVADGENRYRNARLEKGFPPNTNLQTVFDDINESMGLAKGAQIGIPSKKYANGLTLSGLARDHLDVLTKSNGLEWTIQDEALQILPAGLTTSEQAVLLTPNTGLIGSPNKTAKGVEFTSLVQPQLKPGRQVKIESRLLSGSFKIRKVNHEGDSHEGDFLSKCEATK